MTTEALVKPATIQEQLLGKLCEMRQKNLTAWQMGEIARHEKRLALHFVDFTWKYFGIDVKQMKELTEQELNALFVFVSKRAKKAAVYMWIFGICIPMIGWFGILPSSRAIEFTSSLCRLKQMLGSSFNPVQIFRRHFSG